MHLAVLTLLCSFYCAAQSSVPPTNYRLPDDKTNWEEVWKVLKSDTGLSRTDDPNLSVFDTIFRVNAKERGQGTGRSDSNIFLFEADIQMDKNEVAQIISQGSQGSQGTSRGKRAVMRKTNSNLWRPNIAYVIDSGLSARARSVIHSAIREWQDTLPCMGTWTDVTRLTRPRDYMYFFQGGGCYSQVGRRGGGQRVSIGRGCEYHGIAVHEIGHAMGLWHEQSRPDRDSYVRILWNNIIPATKFNFQKHSSARVNSLGVPYDYGSVMHYGATAFARARGLSTIQNIKDRQRLGQRRGLSASDKKQVQILYGCTTVKPTRPSGCSDRPSHKNWCSESQKLGLCTNSLFKSYMTTHCCSTCRPTTPKPAGCSDKQTPRNCRGWKNAKFCQKQSMHYKYMQDNCCKTCNSVPKNCVDKSSKCSSWSSSGYCTDKRYDQYMKKNCAKSCGCI